MLSDHDRHIQQYAAARTHCQFAAHYAFVILDSVYHILQTLSLLLLGNHMDSDVHHLVVDVTDVGDERNVTCAFVQHDYAFEGISEEDIDRSTLYPWGLFIVCTILSHGGQYVLSRK